MAKEFAAQGATVLLSDRTLDAIEQLAEEIRTDGGLAHAGSWPDLVNAELCSFNLRICFIYNHRR